MNINHVSPPSFPLAGSLALTPLTLTPIYIYLYNLICIHLIYIPVYLSIYIYIIHLYICLSRAPAFCCTRREHPTLYMAI